IFKVINDPPVNHYFATYEGVPSDFYLLMAGYGTRMMRDEVDIPSGTPNFASQTQPSIPDILTPAAGQMLKSDVVLNWTGARHLSGVTGYEFQLDRGVIVAAADTFATPTIPPGEHRIRVRAINALANRGGWSEEITFTVTDQYNLTFIVQVPKTTPGSEPIYLTGNFNGWTPGAGENALPLQQISPQEWSVTVSFSPGTALEYKYTRGDWARIEKDSLGAETANRTYTTTAEDAVIRDVVQRWADIPLSVGEEDAVPRLFRLYQNFPNPFNASTTLSFELDHAARVTLRIYDITGEERAALLQGVLKSASRHQVDVDASGWSSGVYFARLQADDREAVTKMILIK
ncbi:MAG: T9SS C-terminal target domain-containing protein, partial [Calditrichaeota bacterium]